MRSFLLGIICTAFLLGCSGNPVLKRVQIDDNRPIFLDGKVKLIIEYDFFHNGPVSWNRVANSARTSCQNEGFDEISLAKPQSPHCLHSSNGNICEKWQQVVEYRCVAAM